MTVPEKTPLSKRTWLILLFALFSLLALLLVAYLDEAPSEESLALQADFRAGTPSPAFVYLYGLDAPEDSAPEALGARRLADPASESLPDQGGLALPEGPLFCGSRDDRDCMRSLFDGTAAISATLASHAVLRQRADTLLRFNEYETQTKPALEEQFPPFQYLSRAWRLMLLQAVSLHQQGDTPQALALLGEQFRLARAMYAQQDSLVGKMVFTRLLMDSLAVQSLMLGRSDGLVAERIEPLTRDEASLREAFAREFAGMRTMFLGLDTEPHFWSDNMSVPAWLTRFLFKPNMTTNALARHYRQLIELSELSPDGFAVRLQEPVFEEAEPSMRNMAGYGLLRALEPEAFLGYVGRVHGLAARIELFNALYHERKPWSAIQSPFADGETAYLEEGAVCVSQPLEMPGYSSCLPVAESFIAAMH